MGLPRARSRAESVARGEPFQNPILPGCYPDPSICRVEDRFYLVTSSFEYFPGIPIFESQDLVHFRQLGHVLNRPSQVDLRDIPSSGGIYAPTLRYWRGCFYLVTTQVGGRGNFYVTSQHPAGPWSDPIWLDREGFDPSLCFADGRVYYTRAGPGPQPDHTRIYQQELDPERGELRGTPRLIWSGTGGPWTEAPHLYKVGNLYYLFAAEGGTSYDHSEVVARSREPFGPFESCPDNPILTHRRRRHPIQAVGHADLVELEDGSWWAVSLGIRPTRGHYHHLGRETFLCPVRWDERGWPVLGNQGRMELEMTGPHLKRRPVAPAAARDDFVSEELEPVWNFVRNPNPDHWSLTARRGFLRLWGSAVTPEQVGSPAMVVRRQQHFRVRCRAELVFDPEGCREEAGLLVRMNEDFQYRLAVRRAESHRVAVLVARTRGRSRVVGYVPVGRRGRIELEIRADPNEYRFAVRGERWLELGRLSTRALAVETINRYRPFCFTGAYIGMYATGNGQRSRTPADFDWFEYQPLD